MNRRPIVRGFDLRRCPPIVRRAPGWMALVVIVIACSPDAGAISRRTLSVDVASGGGQTALPGTALAQPIRVLVRDSTGQPASGRQVTFAVANGGGSVAPATATTGSDGTAGTVFTLGPTVGAQAISATVSDGNTLEVPAVGLKAPLSITANLDGGNPVTCLGISRDVYVQVRDALGLNATAIPLSWSVTVPGDSLASATSLTGSFGEARVFVRLGAPVGVHVIRVVAPGSVAAEVAITIATPCPLQIRTFGDGPHNGSAGVAESLYAYAFTDSVAAIPGKTVHWSVLSGSGSVTPATSITDQGGAAATTFTFGPVPGPVVVQAATDGPDPLAIPLTVLPAAATLVATVAPPAGTTEVRDILVRDGLAFAFASNDGVVIYDVGNGIRGGSPSAPILVSQIVTSDDGMAGGPAVQNGWWFQNPVTGEKRYLFVAQDGPATYNAASSGDIHIVDVSNIAAPVEVGYIHLTGAGPHGLWVDEAHQVLYVAAHDAGVIKVDVSGVLSGDMSARILAAAHPGPGGSVATNVVGVHLVGNALYASDLESGLWALDPITLTTQGGGNNLPYGAAHGSDHLSVGGSMLYTSAWSSADAGTEIAIWAAGINGTPTLANFLKIPWVYIVYDVAVTADGKMVVAVGDDDSRGNGLYVYDRANPQQPQLQANYLVPDGLHRAAVSVVNGRTYVFAAKDSPGPAMMIFDITNIVH